MKRSIAFSDMSDIFKIVTSKWAFWRGDVGLELLLVSVVWVLPLGIGEVPDSMDAHVLLVGTEWKWLSLDAHTRFRPRCELRQHPPADYPYCRELHSMNIFRGLGDFVHLLAFVVLLLKIKATRNAAG